jgi:phage tail sheath protein FI
MPITPTYPGVYVEELPSGVRTIAGVSTSVTTFIGMARRGPINKAVPVRSWADFERRYGGLSAESEMSYSVRQFFNNGGSEGIVIRVASSAAKAHVPLNGSGGTEVLHVTAADAGKEGNFIEIGVAHGTSPNTFSLTAVLPDQENPGTTQTETFDNLSMNSRDPRYVGNVVNATSSLITVKRKDALAFPDKGTSLGGDLTGSTLPPGINNTEFRLSLNGSAPVTITMGTIPNGGGLDDQIDSVCTRIVTEAIAKGGGVQAFNGITCVRDNSNGKRILITSGDPGEFSSVRVLPGLGSDATGILKLGAANGAVDRDAAGVQRPTATPTAAKLVATAPPAGDDLDGLPSGTVKNFKITLDGEPEQTIDLTGIGPAVAADPVLAQANTLLPGIISRVQAKGGAYANFKASIDATDPTHPKFNFSSGSTGPHSNITLKDGPQNILGKLGFANNATATGALTRLAGGDDQPMANDLQGSVLGSKSDRTGMYALDGVDIFNILCIPGVTDAAVLAIAAKYCEDRRAFLVADSPTALGPDAMGTYAQGTSLPKSKNGAVYYPWIGISDPLQKGAIRLTAPSGTIAGVYARTDATRGVWKAPAGTDAALVAVQSMEYALTDPENGVLNPKAVNCLRLFPTYGAVSWGARTLVGANDNADSDWRYVPVRRLALFIEESLYRGTKWAVFEPNDEPLWGQLRMNVGAFMHDLFRQGAFAGKSPRDAYLVKCDRDTTTQSDINNGVVNVLIGFAPLKPAEFVFLKIQQLAGQLNA